MSKPLFKDFDSVSSKAWKQKIQFDLKGADYNDTLIWKTDEGIDVKPFYHADEYNTFPEVSDTKTTAWSIGQTIEVSDVASANLKAIDAIERGAESIRFIINSESVSVSNLVQNIDVSEIPIYFKTSFLSASFIQNAYNIIEDTSNIYFNTDIIGNLAKTGNWYINLKEDHTQFKTITKTTNQLYIDISLYQNAGATAVQQLAYGLAQTNEYLNHLNSSNESTLQSLKIIFNVVVGSNYFFEIAKLKALRQLWNTLASEYNCNTECYIIAAPSKRNKTIYDYNVNMLRTTTECMSAILGGANTVFNVAYDDLYHESNEFGERISRNQLLILKKESYFNAVNNPSDGAYYIENLTQQLAEKALDLFKGIEANGGFLLQLKEGTIQRKIKESAAKEQISFDNGEITLLGTNKHPNTKDRMKDDLEKSPFLKIEKRKTLIEPIIEKRLSETLEIKRLNDE
ncbi:methylmalonyl-CoA mutase subunit beta [Winogradskyella immobilis]|uniref:Methylmalonyl-CoA mutase subunit beta n=1 Tax=Winogradskyella immobilis TaxID=2816852 RepID=A0ABS8EP20_9FLAO|nr:methylmalonyl-CoA mutase subunit beta [Winogradskyella immobilis]MCC1484954.1 methylmalonyl-CoA mutase subunit beta [Winogradskyella immobilis]MCG0017046.1 methylmalonyl-CoA mutase subunit beta [Winogradskyella immobilis]